MTLCAKINLYEKVSLCKTKLQNKTLLYGTNIFLLRLATLKFQIKINLHCDLRDLNKKEKKKENIF